MQDDLTLQAYHYDLPESQIAQEPSDKRDHSRLLVLKRDKAHLEHYQFRDIINLVSPGDHLVVNDTKVFPARLFGTKESGGMVEVFLLNYPVPVTPVEDTASGNLFDCETLIKASRRPRIGTRISINEHCSCTVQENRGRGKWLVRLAINPTACLDDLLADMGKIPLPPYIKRPAGPTGTDTFRYQTVYAAQPGAVAAPTAGLHFTDRLLDELRLKGVTLSTITLHVGYGTFAPVEVEDILRHKIHREFVEISADTARKINHTKKTGGKIWAVGTTTVRALEYAALENGQVQPLTGWCDLYITPGFTFRIIDNLITNFHLPRSSLMFLVAALCGRQQLLNCYREALRQGYRFYSYGDAMAIIG